MKIYVVHVYNAADRLHDYHVHGTLESALRQASCDVVDGRFEDADPDFIEAERARVVATAQTEPGVGYTLVRCDSWRAHVDEMPLFGPAPAQAAKGACGPAEYLPRCWLIRQLKKARTRSQDDLHARLAVLEDKVGRLEGAVLDYAQLRKLYAESRHYVRTLKRERDELIEADRRNTAEQDRLDTLVERMRPVYCEDLP